MDKLYSSINEIRYFIPDNKPNPKWVVHYGSTLPDARKNALREVHRKRMNAAAGSRKLVSVEDEEKGVLENIKRLVPSVAPVAEAAAKAAASKAMIAAINAEGVAVGDSSFEDAGRDAGMMAELLVVKDLDFSGKVKYLKHADERMMAWKKGYGVLTDIEGILHVYCIRNLDGVKLRTEAEEEEPEIILYAG